MLCRRADGRSVGVLRNCTGLMKGGTAAPFYPKTAQGSAPLRSDWHAFPEKQNLNLIYNIYHIYHIYYYCLHCPHCLHCLHMFFKFFSFFYFFRSSYFLCGQCRQCRHSHSHSMTTHVVFIFPIRTLFLIRRSSFRFTSPIRSAYFSTAVGFPGPIPDP